MDVRADDALDNADWTKRTWDIRTPEGWPCETVEDLRYAGYTDATMRKLLTLPAGRAMPARLRAEIESLSD